MKSTKIQRKHAEQHIILSCASDSSTLISNVRKHEIILKMIKEQKKKNKQYRAHSRSSICEKVIIFTLTEQCVKISQISQLLVISFEQHLQTLISSVKQI